MFKQLQEDKTNNENKNGWETCKTQTKNKQDVCMKQKSFENETLKWTDTFKCDHQKAINRKTKSLLFQQLKCQFHFSKNI